MQQGNTNEYIQWIAIVILTILFFNFFIKKTGRKLLLLIPAVFFSVWFTLVAVKVILNNSYGFNELLNVMAGTLPTVVIFSFITFSFKYFKASKQLS
jgi:hypothetical protein